MKYPQADPSRGTQTAPVSDSEEMHNIRLLLRTSSELQVPVGEGFWEKAFNPIRVWRQPYDPRIQGFFHFYDKCLRQSQLIGY